ncbi:MAG: Gx transporter family protein [Eubacteriaceae bacterium]|jgi:heptaprenyl diphosphate synthase
MRTSGITGTRLLARLAVMTAAALVLSWLESFIPMPFPVPGAKPGLANIAVVFTLYTMGAVPALAVSLMRVFLAGFMFGTFSSILYSLSGALLSLAVMILIKRFTDAGIVLTSTLGGIAHNAGQLFCACLVLQTPALLYSWGPLLLVFGTLTGIFIGLISDYLVKRLKTFAGI